MTCSYVVTGGGRGIGRATVERLALRGHVVALDRDADALRWTEDRLSVDGVAGDGLDERTLEAAVDRATRVGRLVGWVNNAAVFRDAALHATPAAEVLELISANLGLAVAGSAAAIRRFLADGTAGAIVNVSSHQAQRAVAGALPYATAKAAIEGLTRAQSITGRAASASTPSPWARSSPSATTPGSTSRCGGCTRSGAPGASRKSPPSSNTCCRTTRASSAARSCPSTAAAPHSAKTPKRAT